MNRSIILLVVFATACAGGAGQPPVISSAPTGVVAPQAPQAPQAPHAPAERRPAACAPPKRIVKLIGAEAEDAKKHVAEATAKPTDESPSRPDGLAVVRGEMTNDALLPWTITQKGRVVGSFSIRMPAGGAVTAELSPSGKYAIVGFSRSGPSVISVATGDAIQLRWDAIVSPDETYALEPVHEHGFTLESENGHDVMRVEIPSGKRHAIAQVGAPMNTDDERARLHTENGVDVCSTGAIYVTSWSKELAVYDAATDRPLVTFADPGPGVPHFDASGRFVATAQAAFRLDP